jgi:cytochrome b561
VARAGRISSSEPEALALRMAKHFAHKVDVAHEAGGVTRIETRFGRIELEPAPGALLLRLDGKDEEKLREVALSHLQRFARGAVVEPVWED